MSLWAELKRRKVFRVGGAYVVIAWLAVQVASIAFPAFEAPAWVLRVFILVLMLGFPLALVMAWMLDVTAEGVRLDAAPLGNKRMGAIAVGLVGLALVWYFIGQPAVRDSGEAAATGASSPTSADPAAAAQRSIAVLAFADLSAEGDQAYFAEGVSEELLNLLARIDGLKVAARTSSFQFKDGKTGIGEIGRALKVDTVLEGSVRKAGEQVRVTAQLIRVSDGFHIWSESYDRRLDNIFAVQDEIAAAIVAALKLKLDVAVQAPARTADVAAYDLYLQGRQLAREPTRAGLLRAISHYEQAIALDPGFASPYSGIAEAWVWLEDYGGERSDEAFPKAERAARRALELDPRAAEALAAMALVRDRMHNDAVGAREAFEQALAINPSYVPAYNLFGDVLRDMGEYRLAVDVHRKAVELDPLSVFMKTRLANKLMDVGQFDEAEALLRGILAQAPDNAYALEEVANLALVRGELADAVAAYQRVHVGRPGDPYAAARIARIGAYLDDEAIANAGLAAAHARGADNRWELRSLGHLARWQQQAAQIDRLSQQTGAEGARWRATAAEMRGDWSQARAQLREALDMGGYDTARVAQTNHADTLIELAWVEKQMRGEDWQVQARAADAILAKAASEGAVRVGDVDHLRFLQARLAGIRGDRALALDHLQGAIAQGFPVHWFLRNDPVFASWREDPAFIALVDGLLAHAAAERAKIAGVVILP
jgi:TolB-like protein/Tfp pilus assembly protein PilF